MREQVTDGHGEVVVWVHQADDGVTMPWRSASGSLAEGDAVSVLEAYEAGHGVRAGAVHADFAVVIDRHERERGIDLFR